jgi:hypothetical protein
MSEIKTWCTLCRKKWEHSKGDRLANFEEHRGHPWGTVVSRFAGLTENGSLAIPGDDDVGFVIAPGYAAYELLPSGS